MERILFYTLTASDAGRTVEHFLRQHNISHRVLVSLKKQTDGILLDGSPIRTIDRLPAQGCLRLCLQEQTSSDTILPQAEIPISIVYEDQDIFVIEKPAGIAVHPSPKNRENTIANGLAFLYTKRNQTFVFRPIGRLDKNTSGLLVIAKNALAAGQLTEQVQHKRMYHTYLAICKGYLPPSGTIHAPIGRLEGSVIARTVCPNGADAVTHFTCLAHYKEHSLVQIRLETGRTHQIRVHFAYIGYPLPGDFLYCPDFSRIQRHPLHAATLFLTHPITQKPLSFSSPLPLDMQTLFPFYDTLSP